MPGLSHNIPAAKRHVCLARRRAGITLLEILVVISIVGMLLALTFAGVQAARESARRAQCQNQLRQIALAIEEFNLSHNHYPEGRFAGAFGVGPDSASWAWSARILPHLEQANLARSAGVPKSLLSDAEGIATTLSVYLCPSDDAIGLSPRQDAGNLTGLRVGVTNYKAVSGANWGADETLPDLPFDTDYVNLGTNGSLDGLNHGDGMLMRGDYARRRVSAQVRDGLSNVFLIGEDVPGKNRWASWAYSNNAYGTCAIPPNAQNSDGKDYDPFDWRNTWSFRSAHPGGVGFAMADGSVRFVSDSIALDVYRACATIAGGEIAANEIP